MKFKEIRKRYQKTQAQVANDMGLKLRTYQNYERGISDPGMDLICRLADYYGVTTDELMGHFVDLVVEQAPDGNTNLNKDEGRLVEIYRAVSHDGQDALMASAEGIYAHYGNTNGESNDE